MIDIPQLDQMIQQGRQAAQYAWEHYEELAARRHTHTLYGPYAYNIGANIPSSITPKQARKLLPKTKRKDYLIYELDEAHKVLRTICVTGHSQIERVFHHFELDGTVYAYPFSGTDKAMSLDKTTMLKMEDGKPVFFAIARKNFLLAQFYEYPDSEKMLITTYRYSPNAKYSIHGYPIDPGAPIGALNSCVIVQHTQEHPEYIDFSAWFGQSHLGGT